MKTRILAVVLLCMGGALSAAEKAAPTIRDLAIDLDPAGSKVRFSVGALLHTVRGSFQVKTGAARVDTATGEASGRIVVDVTSGNTGVAARDRNMHADVLESARFPEAVFSPSRVSGQISLEGESQVEVRGVLRIHGQDRPVVLPTKVKVEGDRVTATATFVMPYVSWGMKDPSTAILRVSDKVQIEISLSGRVRRNPS
jgi:polyisoprenoid-binding protein YceI